MSAHLQCFSLIQRLASQLVCQREVITDLSPYMKICKCDNYVTFVDFIVNNTYRSQL
ncbi:Hypothetical predicted protein, partial [Mytilus galloprovincialis]